MKLLSLHTWVWLCSQGTAVVQGTALWCPVALISPSMCLKQSHAFLKESLGNLLFYSALQCFQQWQSHKVLSL